MWLRNFQSEKTHPTVQEKLVFQKGYKKAKNLSFKKSKIYQISTQRSLQKSKCSFPCCKIDFWNVQFTDDLERFVSFSNDRKGVFRFPECKWFTISFLILYMYVLHVWDTQIFMQKVECSKSPQRTVLQDGQFSALWAISYFSLQN